MNDTERNDGEPPKGRFAAFWTSLPGILTAAAAFIGALAAVLALFIGGGDSGDGGGDSGSSRADWADEVDPICSDASESIRYIPIPQPGGGPAAPLAIVLKDPALAETRAQYLRQVSRIARDMGEKVRAVEAPPDDQGNIDRMTVLWDQQADGMDNIALDIESGDEAGIKSAQQQVSATETEGDALAVALGVPACAQRPVPTE